MSSQGNFELLIPNTMPKSVGYSQVATVTGGTIVFISGQVALDKLGNVVGKDDFRVQVQQVFENLKAAIEATGGTFDDVIKLNSYLVDLSHLSDFREVRDKYVNLKNPPTSRLFKFQGSSGRNSLWKSKRSQSSRIDERESQPKTRRVESLTKGGRVDLQPLI